MLTSFAANPVTNWKDKDCAIYLVVSLATKKAGGSLVSTDLVDVQSFFASVIVPKLKGQDVNGFPMLKAGALKFFTMFRKRSQLILLATKSIMRSQGGNTTPNRLGHAPAH